MDLEQPTQSRDVEPARQLDAHSDVDFAAIYREQARYVWRTLRRLGVAERHLEDLVHDVFVVVHRQLHTYDPARPLRPWLAGIAFRVGSDHRRRAHVRLENLDGDDALEQAGSAHRDRPEEELVARQRRRRLYALLERLDFEKRAVFVLHELEGHAIPEIEEITGVGANTLYSRLRLARQEIRRGMEIMARQEKREST